MLANVRLASKPDVDASFAKVCLLFIYLSNVARDMNLPTINNENNLEPQDAFGTYPCHDLIR